MKRKRKKIVTTTVIENVGNPGLLSLLKFGAEVRFPDGTAMKLGIPVDEGVPPVILCLAPSPASGAPGTEPNPFAFSSYPLTREGLDAASVALNAHRERHGIESVSSVDMDDYQSQEGPEGGDDEPEA